MLDTLQKTEQKITAGKEAMTLLTGGISIPTFLIGTLYALAGMLVVKYLYYKFRNVSSPHSSKKFNLKYYLQNNIADMGGALLLVILGIRFYTEVITKFYPEHVKNWGQNDMFVCLLMGVLFQPITHKLYYWINKKQFLEKSSKTKKIYFVIKSISDLVVSIDGEEFNLRAELFVTGHTGYFFEDNGAGGYWLCTEVPETIPTLTGKFKDTNGAVYTLVSKNFVSK